MSMPGVKLATVSVQFLIAFADARGARRHVPLTRGRDRRRRRLAAALDPNGYACHLRHRTITLYRALQAREDALH